MQFWFIGFTLLAFVVMGYMLNKSIKQYEVKKQLSKKKKGKMKYTQESKKF
jgi:hypothetical protein